MCGRWIGSLLVAVLLWVSSAANAAQGDWLGRARAIYIDHQVSSSPLNLDVDSRVTPELDFSYFVTNNLALELILATQRHEVKLNGASVGHVTHLPPTLTLQYHFLPQATIRPYVGAGVNYTRFYDISLGSGTLTVDKNSWGGALQAGADFQLSNRFFLNVDIKKIWIGTDVKAVGTGATLSNLKINPLVFGIGVGMKF